jgi:hypothetical protein
LATVAAWIDETERHASDPEFSVRCHSNAMFRWKNIPGENPGSVPWGGVFGVQNYARPRAILTLFGFASLEHYQSVKQYLTGIDLVVLTDKWLRHENPRFAYGRRIR